MELGGFAQIAPYLTDPLVLAGFGLLLFFGLLRAVLKSKVMPTVSQSAGGKALLSLLRYGFVIALVVVILGFALVFFQHWRNTEELARYEAQLEAQLAELKDRSEVDQQTIASLNSAYQDLLARAEQPGAGPAIKDALAAAAAGDNAAAEAIYAEILRRKSQEGAEANQEAAEAARHLGALAYLNDTQKAIQAYQEATRLDPDDTWSWIFLGRLYQRAGSLAAAGQAFQRALEAAEQARDERDIGVAHHELGTVRQSQGDLAGALNAYERYHTTAEQLAAQDHTNSEWQRDLTVSFDRIGDVQSARGNLDGALQAYQDSLAIADKLAAMDPTNRAWQRDLIVSNVKLAEVAEQQHGRSDAALGYYQHALDVATTLQSSGRLAPVDAWMIEELKARLERVSASAKP